MTDAGRTADPGPVRVVGKRQSSTRAIPDQLPLPFVELFSWPSPLEHLPGFSRAVGGGVDVWMKREDLIPVGIGGNKVRNLEFIIGEAVARGADVVVVYGRGRANHNRLTAAAAARAGLRCVMVLTGPAPAVPSPNERLSALLGAEMRYAADDRPETRAALLADVLAELRAAGAKVYEAPFGAAGPLGGCGQVLAGLELARQLDDAGVHADYVFLAAATGANYAGLRVGLWLAGLDGTTVVGVPSYFSTATSEAEFRGDLRALMTEVRAQWRRVPAGTVRDESSWDDTIVIDDTAPWLPYWVPGPGAEEAAALLGATEGICVEPVYTARTAAAIRTWAASGRLDGKTVVMWHGGGLPALFEEYGGLRPGGGLQGTQPARGPT
jgi:1-aminocyclopropane-1-carboxylate deaminase/D-cysteine desulfhydrase-like pyridoxal-dependent ACC family enzyme